RCRSCASTTRASSWCRLPYRSSACEPYSASFCFQRGAATSTISCLPKGGASCASRCSRLPSPSCCRSSSPTPSPAPCSDSRLRQRARAQIPDFTDRTDEIGHLSGALRDMTNALYKRIDAIESFAADVAHELKNPLTSLRSATETLPLAKNDDSRERLMEIIKHDVKRLDRLISDISDASRLDAELA